MVNCGSISVGVNHKARDWFRSVGQAGSVCHEEMLLMQKLCWEMMQVNFNDTDIDSWLALFTFKHGKYLRYHGIHNGPCTKQQLVSYC